MQVCCALYCRLRWISRRKKLSQNQRLETDKRDTAFLLMSTAFVCVSNWLPVCLLLLATFDVCCFAFVCLSLKPGCVYLLKKQKKNKKIRKKNHTRQELISPAVNSHSRRSFFFFQNERTEWKLWPYMQSSVEQSSWDCFQLQALYFVSVYFSAFI